MQNNPLLAREETSWLTFHPATPQDRSAMAEMRIAVEPNKGRLQGPAAREPYDSIMNRVVAPDGVTYDAGSVGGVAGWWCRPENARRGEVILHLHGGWFTFGSAQAFRNLVGHIAAKAGAAAFIPDYRRAPEDPFPAAVQDARACLDGLVKLDFRRIAVTGDSAGGGLALMLLHSEARPQSAVLPVGAVALSPVTDLTLTGTSWETRAKADPYFTRPQVEAMVAGYLNRHDANDPVASPLYGDFRNLPPIRVHVGDDEVLLDDSIRYVQRAATEGADAKVDVWECMAHGFIAGVGKMQASNEALEAIGKFLREQLTGA